MVQETWALLRACHAVRELISATALARQDPLRVRFINALTLSAARPEPGPISPRRADRPDAVGAGRSGPGASWPDAPSPRQNRDGSTQPFIAYSATQATVMVSMVPLGCAVSWFCDCRVRFMGMVGHWAGEPSELLETVAQTRPSIV